MPTDAQLTFLRNLYADLGQEPEADIEDLSVKQASARIKELKALKDKREHQGEWKKEDWWQG